MQSESAQTSEVLSRGGGREAQGGRRERRQMYGREEMSRCSAGKEWGGHSYQAVFLLSLPLSSLSSLSVISFCLSLCVFFLSLSLFLFLSFCLRFPLSFSLCLFLFLSQHISLFPPVFLCLSLSLSLSLWLCISLYGSVSVLSASFLCIFSVTGVYLYEMSSPWAIFPSTSNNDELTYLRRGRVRSRRRLGARMRGKSAARTAERAEMGGTQAWDER